MTKIYMYRSGTKRNIFLSAFHKILWFAGLETRHLGLGRRLHAFLKLKPIRHLLLVMSPITRTDGTFLALLREYGARRLLSVRFRRNRSTIWSVTQGGTVLNLHTGYRSAPDYVVHALAVVAGQAGSGSQAYRSAAKVARDWPGIEEAIQEARRVVVRRRGTVTRYGRPGRCAGTDEQRTYLNRLYAYLNHTRFAGLLPESLSLRWSDRMTSRLGQMVAMGRGPDRRVVEIALNVDLLMPGNGRARLDTMLHEMAHVAAYLHEGDRGHGPSWRRWAERAGCSPRPCADERIRRRRRGAAVTAVPRLPEGAFQLQLGI